MRYRRDIDGLRAVAVISVVAYHTGMGILPGGFVGVDVFFVISGYLITSILLGEMRDGRYTIAGFYERRMLRLFPALFAMLATTVTAAWLVLFPADLEEFGQTLRATVLFLSNLHFVFSYGYFAEAAEANPLLHTWSLAVEEQFYILFPPVLYLAFRYGRVGALIICMALLSFAVTLGFAPLDPERAFFLPHFRAWELLLGAALAARLVPGPRSERLAGLVGLAGLSAIAVSVVTLDRGVEAAPALWLMPVVAGTAALIWAGDRSGNVASRLLGLRPAVFVGLISYSLYLWHWPVFVFWKALVAEELTAVAALGLCLLSIAIATASWRFVEQPGRHLRGRVRFRNLAAVYGIGAIAMIGISVAGEKGDGWPHRFSAEIREILEVRSDYLNSPARRCLQGELRRSETLSPDQIDAAACRFGAGATPDFVVWGDSHAGAMIPAFEGDWLGGRSGVLLARPGCPPVDGLQPLGAVFAEGNPEECVAFNAMVRRYIEVRQPRSVLLIARWAFHLDHKSIAGEGGVERRRFDDVQIAQALRTQVDWLGRQGIEVGILAPIPYPGFDVPMRLASDLRLGVAGRTGQDIASYRAANANALRLLEGLDTVRIIEVAPLICAGGSCALTQEGKPLYADSSHLSPLGARLLQPALREFLLGR